MKGSIGRTLLSVAMAVCINGCSGAELDESDLNKDRLAGCPHRPNCVSSEAKDDRHAIPPFHLKNDPAAGWKTILNVVGRLPRATVEEETEIITLPFASV